MAIKLETKNQMPSAVASITFTSAGDTPSISLVAEEMRAQVNGEWTTAQDKRKQVVTFIGNDGKPCQIDGTVPEADAVEIAAAWKIVVFVAISNQLKATFEAGRKSQAYVDLKLVRVIEVWDTPKSCLWKAVTGISRGSGHVAEMGEDGKIVRKAV